MSHERLQKDRRSASETEFAPGRLAFRIKNAAVNPRGKIVDNVSRRELGVPRKLIKPILRMNKANDPDVDAQPGAGINYCGWTGLRLEIKRPRCKTHSWRPLPCESGTPDGLAGDTSFGIPQSGVSVC